MDGVQKILKTMFHILLSIFSTINPVNSKRSHIAAAQSTAYTSDYSANDSPWNCTNTSQSSTNSMS